MPSLIEPVKGGASSAYPEIAQSGGAGLTEYVYFRGRVAMAAILRGLGVKGGDDVLIQAFTCIAVPEAVMSIGARPRYVDVASGSPNMDPDDLARKIRPDTRAVVIQHSFGLPANVEQLSAVARDASIPMIEDCAHTIESRVGGRRVGTFGAAAFYSYEASKPVFVGIGGSAISNDPALTAKLNAAYPEYEQPPTATQLQIAAMFLAHKVVYSPSTYWTVRGIFRAMVAAGIIKGNYNEVAGEAGPSADFSRRMGARQAQMLATALRRLDQQSDHRRWVAGQYRSRISGAGVTHLPHESNVAPVFGRYPMLVEDKERWVEGARAAKVELADFYATPIHPLKGDALRRVGYKPGSCPQAEWVADRIVSLPTGPQTDRKQIQRAVDYFNR